MPTPKRGFRFLVFSFFMVGLILVWYRHAVHEVPFDPGERQNLWSIEAKITFDAQHGPVKVSFATPQSQSGFTYLGERTASPGYGLSYIEHTENRRAEWSIRYADGPQTLYYQVDMLALTPAVISTPRPPGLQKFTHVEPEATAAQQLLLAAQNRSIDNWTLAKELIAEFNQQKQQSQLLEISAPRIQWLVELLNNIDIPARKVHTLFLEDGRRRQDLVPALQVFQKGEYRLFNPQNGMQGRRENQIIWQQAGDSIIDVIGGQGTHVSFSMLERDVPINQLKTNTSAGLLNFSIHSLPLEEQTLFKGILLIPVGVLIVVFMRILVGIRTSGTFMPVLIALAFIQTSLLTGLISFILILALGLSIRAYLSQHNLLLVARISAVIVVVIFIIATVAVLSFQMGLSEGLKVTFFPMVILAWTIERMSILWEEEGAKEVFVQSGGSLFLAILIFIAMKNDWVRHLTFNFIGFQFIFMAFILQMGSYTGYRISELLRFREFAKNSNDSSPPK